MKKLLCVSSLIALGVAPSIASLAEAADFQAIGGGSATAYAMCVSGDGTVVGGMSSGGAGYRWTATGGVVGLDFQPSDASLDGSVMVGTRGFGEAVRWTQSGSVGLDDLTPGNGSIYSFALAVSADGSIVVGATADDPFAWTQSGGMSAAPAVPVDAYNGANIGVSADGSVLAGIYQIDVPAPPPQFFRTETHAYRAVGGVPTDISGIFLGMSVSGMSADGNVLFGQVNNQAAFWKGGNVTVIGSLPPFPYSFVEGASATGDCIVGTLHDGAGTSEAMIWDDINGVRVLRDVLEDDFGLGSALTGWSLAQANDVSDDCTTIVGSGFSPSGGGESWIATGFSKDGVQQNCAQPLSSGPKPTATDCLFILNVAVGLDECLSACVCAPKGTLPPSATDAALCLAVAVGQSITLNCPCGS